MAGLKQKGLKNSTKETMVGWAFASPLLIIFLVLVIYPVITSFALSFADWNFLSGIKGIRWAGVDNFVRLFTRDRKFTKAVTNTLVFTVVSVPISLFIDLTLAYMLNNKIHLLKFNRFCFFIPYISNVVALTAVFRFLFRTDGIINKLAMNYFGIGEPLNLLVDRQLCIIPAICIMVYSGMGYAMVIYLAALQNVPQELYESAKIDGANGVAQFFKITFPMISPTTFYLLVVKIIGGFKTFSIVKILGIEGAKPTLVTRIYSSAFADYDFGYASAMAWVLVVMILIVTAIQFWGQKRWVHY